SNHFAPGAFCEISRRKRPDLQSENRARVDAGSFGRHGKRLGFRNLRIRVTFGNGFGTPSAHAEPFTSTKGRVMKTTHLKLIPVLGLGLLAGCQTPEDRELARDTGVGAATGAAI